MTDATKFRICQLVTFLSIAGALLCLGRMSPWASPHHNKALFVLLMADIVIGLVSAVGYYFYRSRIHEAASGKIEVQTLAAAGGQSPQQSSPQLATINPLAEKQHQAGQDDDAQEHDDQLQ